MAEKKLNVGRRQFLTAATSVVAVAGAVGVAVPFVGSWNPSAKAKAAGAPVKFDVSKMEPGQLVRVEWRGQPVFVIRRTKEQIDDLSSIDNLLKDPNSMVSSQPDYVDSRNRALKEEFLVLVGLCTHLGCSPKYIEKLDVSAPDSEWKGGFFCACHGSKFDMAGRVYKGVPASENLVVPPYRYQSESVIEIGLDGAV